MDENNRNFITAIVLSIGVLFAWQYFFVPNTPQPPPGQQTAEQKTQTPAQQQPGPPQPRSEVGAAAPAGTGVQPGAPQVAAQTRDEALASDPRVAIDTLSIKGSINLKGARIDDVVLKKYRETVNPSSPNVVLLSSRQGRPTPITRSMVGRRGRQGHYRARRRYGVEGGVGGPLDRLLPGHPHL